MNVIPIPVESTRRRLLDKIVAGEPLNPAEKSWLRWAATQGVTWPPYHPEQTGRNREPAA